MSVVHQVIDTLAPRDAVSNHALQVRASLREAGHESDIFARVVSEERGVDGRSVGELEGAAATTDLLIYHMSTGSDAAEDLLGLDTPFVVNHHNFTPAEFFERWDVDAAANMRRADQQLRALGRRAALGIADSRFNASQLEDAGFSRVEVAPLLVDLNSVGPDQRTSLALQRVRRGAHWLFVGRIAPNKCQHDIVTSFAAYRRLHDPGARLTFVGSRAVPSYWDAVLGLADHLGLGSAVTIVSDATDAELSAYYADADVFVCLSEHEGFCIPLLEAMSFGTPIVAFDAAAVPDTIGAAGMILTSKDPVVVATAVRRVLADAPWRARLAAASQAVLLGSTIERSRAALIAVLERLLDGERAGA